MKKIILGLLPIAFLSACSSIPTNSVESINSMSCNEISRNIGSYESKLEDRQYDSVAAGIDSVFGNTTERVNGDIDETIADMDIDEINGELQKLRTAYNRKGCYRR